MMRWVRRSLLLPLVLGALLLLGMFAYSLRKNSTTSCHGRSCEVTKSGWLQKPRAIVSDLIWTRNSTPSQIRPPVFQRDPTSSTSSGDERRKTHPATSPPPTTSPSPSTSTNTTTPASTLIFKVPRTTPQVIQQLYDYIRTPQTQLCGRTVKVGGFADYRYRHVDGHKWVCLDRRLGLLEGGESSGSKNGQKDNTGCLVYSFGVDHDWSFDDNVQLLQCRVHAFDPSLGLPDHDRTSRITFHNVGISGADGTKHVNGRQWTLRTYKSLVHQLGHENRTVHYLKVDVEGAEWQMLPQIAAESPELLARVKQLGVEIHMALGGPEKRPSNQQWRSYLRTMIALERAGFRLTHAEVNPYEPAKRYFSWYPHDISGVYELAWIKFP